jgi:TonB-dependent SusC/RagA subfamily outer membrane receptor
MIGRAGYGAVVNALLMVPGVAIRSGFLTFLGGDGRGGNAQSEPMIVVDGSQILPGRGVPNMGDVGPVVQYLNLFPPGDIDFIEVLTGADAAIYGLRGGNGVIVINTKTGSANSSNSPSALKVISPKTYHNAPPFDMPDYSTKELKETKVPDMRNTIYWAGNLITDVSGKASISFYTADASTTYSVIITGITANGENIYRRISINRK